MWLVENLNQWKERKLITFCFIYCRIGHERDKEKYETIYGLLRNVSDQMIFKKLYTQFSVHLLHQFENVFTPSFSAWWSRLNSPATRWGRMSRTETFSQNLWRCCSWRRTRPYSRKTPCWRSTAAISQVGPHPPSMLCDVL